MQRGLIIAGLALIVIGVAWKWLVRLPIGRLPGDIVIDRPGLRVFVPLTTMLLASALLTLLGWLFRK